MPQSQIHIADNMPDIFQFELVAIAFMGTPIFK